jgi:hypothetical protein
MESYYFFILGKLIKKVENCENYLKCFRPLKANENLMMLISKFSVSQTLPSTKINETPDNYQKIILAENKRIADLSMTTKHLICICMFFIKWAFEMKN